MPRLPGARELPSATGGRLQPAACRLPPASIIPTTLPCPQWAVQNAAGMVFATLFITVGGLRFPLACVASVLTAVALLMLSPDRTAGGRICAGALFCATVLSGTVIGGIVVSLAFLARGRHEPYITYLPPRMQAVGAWPQGPITELKMALANTMARLAVTDLPPALTELVRGTPVPPTCHGICSVAAVTCRMRAPDVCPLPAPRTPAAGPRQGGAGKAAAHIRRGLLGAAHRADERRAAAPLHGPRTRPGLG